MGANVQEEPFSPSHQKLAVHFCDFPAPGAQPHPYPAQLLEGPPLLLRENKPLRHVPDEDVYDRFGEMSSAKEARRVHQRRRLPQSSDEKLRQGWRSGRLVKVPGRQGAGGRQRPVQSFQLQEFQRLLVQAMRQGTAQGDERTLYSHPT